MAGGGGGEQAAAKTTRLPGQQDAAVRAAQLRAQQAKQRTTGRTSTILTDALQRIVGSQGKLGS